jgi:hypothetical protein
MNDFDTWRDMNVLYFADQPPVCAPLRNDAIFMNLTEMLDHDMRIHQNSSVKPTLINRLVRSDLE